MRWARLSEAVRFIGFCVLLAIAYGVMHDLVTAHVSVEYFTEFHPRLVASEHPVVMALLWGVIATWWVGLIGGFLLAMANLVGQAPQLEWGLLRRRVAFALAVVYVLTMSLLVAALTLIPVNPKERTLAEAETGHRLVTVLIVHVWSYGLAGVSVLVLMVWTALARWKLGERQKVSPR